MDINLGKQVAFNTINSDVASGDKVTLIRYIDNPNNKVVFAKVKEIDDRILLWSGADYDAIGQWTEEQAQAKLIERVLDIAAKSVTPAP